MGGAATKCKRYRSFCGGWNYFVEMLNNLNESIVISESYWVNSNCEVLDKTIIYTSSPMFTKCEHGWYNMTIFTNTGNDGDMK